MAARMKDSGIEGIGLIPENWDETRRVKDIFTLSKGLPITKDNLLDEGLPVISYGQVHSKDNTGTFIKDLLIRYVDYGYRKDRTSQVKKGDFIFADTSEDLEGCGNCVYVDREDEIFAGYHTVTFCSDNTDNRYLAYLFTTDAWRTQIRKRVYAVKVYTVSQKILKECKVILPPQREQRAIADFLDKCCAQIDDVITDLEKQIALLRQHKKSTTTESIIRGLSKNVCFKDSEAACVSQIPVSWNMSKIKYLIDTSHPYPIGDGDHGMIKSDDYCEEGIPYIRVLNLTRDQGLSMENLVYISKEQNALIKNSELKPDDLLIAKTGATIGKVAIVPEWMPISNTTSHVGKITLPKNQCPKYFYYQMISDVIQNQIQDMSAMQSTRPELGIEGLKNLIVVVPPLDEQRKIAEYLDHQYENIDSIISEKKKQLELIQAQKKSLIYEYVTGKKRVKEVESYAN